MVELDLVRQAEETARRYGMLLPGGTVVAALSGGADSVALLHWLCSKREALGLRLTAAHLNHCLRAGASEADEAFCRDYCAALGVPLVVERADVAALAKEQRRGVEEAGRNARYAFFARVALAQGCAARVALAHTLSDRTETLLLNLRRGAALRGLCSIPPLRLPYVRPLIACTREQVETYCAAHRLEYCVDGSNFDTRYCRNFVRHEIMPRLHPNAASLRGLFQALEADQAYLEEQAGRLYDAAQTQPDLLFSAPEALRGRVLRRMLAEGGREPTRRRIWALEQRLKGKSRAEISLREASKRVVLERIERGDPNFTEYSQHFHKGGLANCLDCDTINGDLSIGQRQEGDRMRLCNGAGTKSFKKLCQERGISPEKREALTVLRDEGGMIWLEGLGCAHRCRVTERTDTILRIHLEGA
ncbi:MAG: tRNA lysidine(34) synthetase TilS [Oscillospiraceae bacterium]|jgi:tRNA(Ile)-lysidine synthase|nr:tRNA lysidine(34) synthetase TilS [Oscillospiraceae bacterium]